MNNGEIAAASWAIDNKTIMAPEGGENAGRVADSGAAEELAYTEATMGRDAALSRQQELQRQAETGLTDEERNNVEIMDGIEKKYPDAVIPYVDSKGRKFLIVSPRPDGDSGSDYIRIVSQYGVFTIDLGPIGGGERYNKVDWTSALNGIADMDFGQDYVKSLGVYNVVNDPDVRRGSTADRLTVYNLDLAQSSKRETLKEYLTEAKERVVRRRKNSEAADASRKAANVLADL